MGILRLRAGRGLPTVEVQYSSLEKLLLSIYRVPDDVQGGGNTAVTKMDSPDPCTAREWEDGLLDRYS